MIFWERRERSNGKVVHEPSFFGVMLVIFSFMLGVISLIAGLVWLGVNFGLLAVAGGIWAILAIAGYWMHRELKLAQVIERLERSK